MLTCEWPLGWCQKKVCLRPEVRTQIDNDKGLYHNMIGDDQVDRHVDQHMNGSKSAGRGRGPGKGQNDDR